MYSSFIIIFTIAIMFIGNNTTITEDLSNCINMLTEHDNNNMTKDKATELCTDTYNLIQNNKEPLLRA